MNSENIFTAMDVDDYELIETMTNMAIMIFADHALNSPAAEALTDMDRTKLDSIYRMSKDIYLGHLEKSFGMITDTKRARRYSKIRLGELNLPSKIVRIFLRANITTVEDVWERNVSILKIPGVGVSTRAKLIAAMRERGIPAEVFPCLRE